MAAPCGRSNAAVSVKEEQEEQEEQEWRAYPGGNNWWYSDEQSSATSKVKDEWYSSFTLLVADTRNAKEGCYDDWGGQEEWYVDGNWWPANPSIKTEAFDEWGTENGSGAAKQSKKRKSLEEEVGWGLDAQIQTPTNFFFKALPLQQVPSKRGCATLLHSLLQ